MTVKQVVDVIIQVPEGIGLPCSFSISLQHDFGLEEISLVWHSGDKIPTPFLLLLLVPNQMCPSLSDLAYPSKQNHETETPAGVSIL